MLTQGEVSKLIEGYEKLKSEAELLLDWHHENIREINNYQCLKFESIDDEYIYYYGEFGGRYDSEETCSYSLKIELLWSQEARDSLLEEAEIERNKVFEKEKKKRMKEVQKKLEKGLLKKLNKKIMEKPLD